MLGFELERRREGLRFGLKRHDGYAFRGGLGVGEGVRRLARVRLGHGAKGMTGGGYLSAFTAVGGVRGPLLAELLRLGLNVTLGQKREERKKRKVLHF
jgi:hypothetical protein